MQHSPPATASLAVAGISPAYEVEAALLAERLGLPLAVTCADRFDYLLLLDAGGLALVKTGLQAPLPLRIDFSEYLQQRGEHAGGELLARALRPRGAEPPSVLDATAGLGRDALMMAALGCRVTMLERAPYVAALLDDALVRARCGEDAAAAEVAGRMQLLHGDARQLMASQAPDVVYLDPMFAHRKRGLSKKGMQFFQALIGDDVDSGDLLEPALACARKRVVVKRHAKAPFLAGRKPDFSQEGKAVRFDVYLCPKG